jgi:hypothetical protein
MGSPLRFGDEKIEPWRVRGHNASIASTMLGVKIH